MSKDIVKIDSYAFVNEISKQGLKIWWLAEQLGLDRKTVSRWVNGKVKWIRRENLLAAATILGCAPETLMVQSEVILFASREDQLNAAHSIYSENLLSTLAGSGKLELAELLIRSLLRPDLPVLTLANLYLELANCCWQQGKFSETANYALRVLEIGEQLCDTFLVSRAQQYLASFQSKGGKLSNARNTLAVVGA